uniref:Uncharacterized protein n=1 Tax=Anguilla anguilla TaxID=7936 RepID=A0A0E9VT93_ANGAN
MGQYINLFVSYIFPYQGSTFC